MDVKGVSVLDNNVVRNIGDKMKAASLPENSPTKNSIFNFQLNEPKLATNMKQAMLSHGLGNNIDVTA